ncbi:hypothetical protein BDV25DRAFT_167526 [Aspergillus avenaceus]|uniref:Uncharacterized protein n=1 Tax=Aspergillus avenaceus TaxID=36643 RepID=A0A5N6TCZ7_ASPAV|nr:hypothetical protein BDV25DRAFT_167526 [Aspergillus avenaceus]
MYHITSTAACTTVYPPFPRPSSNTDGNTIISQLILSLCLTSTFSTTLLLITN